jgi:DNA replication and repair protein RecF
VEHEYADIMSKYNKILLQRNIALRHKIKNYRIWDKQLIDYGLKIDLIRKKYIDVFQQYLEKMTSCYDVLNNINIRYKQGWNRQLSLDEAIASEEDTDLSYTYYGPHRADIGIYIGDVLAYEYLSSGQLKVLAILLILSQLKVTKEIRNESPILLFDDFQSELDHINKDLILSTIRNLHCQAFITSIESNIDFKSEFEGKLFHVEHGEIL